MARCILSCLLAALIGLSGASITMNTTTNTSTSTPTTTTNTTTVTTTTITTTTTNTTMTTNTDKTTTTNTTTTMATTNTTTTMDTTTTTDENTTTGVATSPGEQFNNTFLNPGGSSKCPSKCRYYFAGASATDPMFCQKQSSGVGLAEQNMKMGVACYPPYGCGRDMITCVSQAWTEPLPDVTNAALSCAGLASLTAEDPWKCGTSEEGRSACNHNTPNNNKGKWLKATANLDCGWGSTYGNVRPGYAGHRIPYSVFFTGISSDYECCLKAMEFEGSTWDEGGAALFFQQGRNSDGQAGDHCRVDRETIIYANMDSSSGRSVKYQDTRCGADNFFYRHAAGAADAANLHTGGKCVLQGAFKRAPLTSGTNLPKGELPDGCELPNHKCDANSASHEGCGASLKFNTIADAEECCNMCTKLSWLAPNAPNVGGDAARDPSTGLHTNPCVAWQIVEGRCRITRKAYFNYWNPSQTVLQAITDSDYSAPGNTDWVIPTRGCGNSMQACNYYSWIYYREVGTPEQMVQADMTFRKIMKPKESIDLSRKVDFTFSASSVPSRRESGRSDLVSTDSNSPRRNAKAVGSEMGGTDCGRVEIHDAAQVLAKSGDYDVFDEEKDVKPLCVSSCISSGSTTLSCNVNSASSGRRLVGSSDLLLSFTSLGSGYDQVNFQAGILISPVKATTTGIDGGITGGTAGGASGGSTVGSTGGSTTGSTAGSVGSSTVGTTGGSTGGTTETGTTTSAATGTSTRVTGQVSFALPGANKTMVEDAAQTSIATHFGVAASLVSTTAMEYRRLGVGPRRLPGVWSVVFEFQAPASVAAAIANKVAAIASDPEGFKTSFATHFKAHLIAAGVDSSVVNGLVVREVTAVVDTTGSATTSIPEPSSGAYQTAASMVLFTAFKMLF